MMQSIKISQNAYFTNYNTSNNKDIKKSILNLAQILKCNISNDNDKIKNKLNGIAVRIQKRINNGLLELKHIKCYQDEIKHLLGDDKILQHLQNIDDFLKCCILLAKHSTNNARINCFGINKTASIIMLSESDELNKIRYHTFNDLLNQLDSIFREQSNLIPLFIHSAKDNFLQFSAVSTDDKIYDAYNAKRLLFMYRNAWSKEIFQDMVKTFINNLISLDNRYCIRNAFVAEELLIMLKKEGLLDNNTFNDLIKKCISNCGRKDPKDIIINNINVAKHWLTKFQSEFDKDTFKSMVETLMNNCIAVVTEADNTEADNDSRQIRYWSGAIDLLKTFRNEFDKDTFKSMVKTLIHNYIAVITKEDGSLQICHRSGAMDLLKPFRNEFDKDTFKSMVKTFIDNCSTLQKSNGFICDETFTIYLLQEFHIAFDEEFFQNIIKNIFNNWCKQDEFGIIQNVFAVSRLLSMLNRITFNIDILKCMVVDFINQCSAIVTMEQFECTIVQRSCVAIKLLNMFREKLDKDTFKSMVKTLIGNCITVWNEDDNILEVLYTLQEGFDINTLKTSIEIFMNNYINTKQDGINNLFKTIIENYKRYGASFITWITQFITLFEHDNFVVIVRDTVEHCEKFININGFVSIKLFKDIKIALGEDRFNNIFGEIIKTLINNWNTVGINVVATNNNLSNVITLLNDHKTWLRQNHYDFYLNKVEDLFNNDQSNEFNICTILSNHGDVISTELLVIKYNATRSNLIRETIEQYVRQYGRETPFENAVMNPAYQMHGVAFEVHNYTNGTEVIIIEVIASILSNQKRNFTLENLRFKFALLDSSESTQCNNVLQKILQDSNYKRKINSILPNLGTFLNTNYSLWTNHSDDSESRWKLWLQQSFIEAATAYDTINHPESCVKGIYERLFTGFRTMHPAIDILFVMKDIIKYHKDCIGNTLKSEQLLTLVINALIGNNININDKEFDNILKKYYLQQLKLLINNQIRNRLDELKQQLSSTLSRNTMRIITQYLNNECTVQNINKIIDTTCKDGVDNIEFIERENGILLVDYIKQTLENANYDDKKPLVVLV